MTHPERRQQDYAKAATIRAIENTKMTRRQRRAATRRAKLKGKGWTK